MATVEALQDTKTLTVVIDGVQSRSPRNADELFEAQLFAEGRLNMSEGDLVLRMEVKIDEIYNTSVVMDYLAVSNMEPDSLSLGLRREVRKASTQAEAFIVNGIGLIQEENAWLANFNGRVPALWGDPSNPWALVEAFSRAGKEGVTLSSELVDAAILHPHIEVLGIAVNTHVLNVNQLACVLQRVDTFAPPIFVHNPNVRVDEINWREQIIEIQSSLGVSPHVISEALMMTSEVSLAA